MLKYIEDLLQGAEVEWTTLGEVSKRISSGGTPRTGVSNYYGGDIPWLRTQEVNFTEIWDTEVKLSPEGFAASSAKWIPENSVIVAMYGATVGRVGINKVPITTNQACANIEVDEQQANYRYVFHYLYSQYPNIKAMGQGVQSNISLQIVRQIPIPLPPLSVQAEIVRILDKFTSLEAELDCRKRQYEHYRNQLLSFENTSRGGVNNVIWKPLGEVGEFVRGSGLQKKDFTSEGVPAIHYGQIYTYYGTSTEKTISFVSEETARSLKKVNYGNVIITNTSENLEDVGKALVYLGEEEAVTGGHASIFKPSSLILSKYFAYFTQTDAFAQQKRAYAKGTKVIDVSATDMKKILIPLPPLSEQERIVGILDRFEALAHSMSEGLPREIALRRQQYEHYRRELLDFARPQS